MSAQRRPAPGRAAAGRGRPGASSSSRTAWCSGRRARRACSARRRVQEGVPRWLYRVGPRLDDGRVLAAAGVDRRAHRARGRARQAGRAHGRDPAADRPRAARRRRLRGARRAHRLPRLRRAAGRRRHALRRDLGAYVAARRALDRFGLSKALTGSVAAVSVGVVDGESLLDLDYVGGLERRRRPERRHDRRRAASSRCRRRPSRCRSTARGSTSCSISPRPGSRSSRRFQQDAVDAPRRVAPSRSAAGTRSCGSPSPARSARAVGVERELRDREAGIRTHLLVSLGSALFTIVSAYGFHDFLTAAATSCGRPDAHRRADRDRHRLPRRRRDHPRGPVGARADDGGDALGRRRDRHGVRARATTGPRSRRRR